ncbi:MAG: hypothetical protein Cons2KO_16880 [Congregibacter sp.]
MFRFAAIAFAVLAGIITSLSSSALASEKVSSVVREAFAVRLFDNIELPQNSVRAVHVDTRGYLWAGTREGLVRYKAGSQTVFQQTQDGKTGLPSAMINTIYEDSKGTIWVGTARGVAAIPAGAEDFQVVLEATNVRKLDVLNISQIGDSLIAATVSGSLFRLSLVDGASELRLRHELHGLTYPAEEDHANNSAASAAGSVFFASTHNTIFRLQIDGDAFDLVEMIETDNPVIEIQANDDSLFWLERLSGFMSRPLNGGETRQVDPLAGDTQGYYRAMNARSARSAWFAAGPNIVRVRGDDVDIVRLPGRGNEVRSISFDGAGNVWIGTYYGLYYALDTQFSTLKTAASYESGVISSLAATSDRLFMGGQNLWVGDLNADVFQEITNADGLPTIRNFRLDPQAVGQDPITSLAATDRLLLVGYFIGGLDVIDLKTGETAVIDQQPSTGENLENAGVSGFAELGPNRWLASLYLYGLVEIEVSPTDGTPEVSMRRVLDHQGLVGVHRVETGRYLVASENDAFIVDRESDGSYSTREFSSPPEGIVFAAEPDGLGGVYLGMENAGASYLSKRMLDRGEFTPRGIPVIEKYLARRTIWHMQLDARDIMWITTNNGVYVFDLPNEELISHITYRDGLPANEFEYGPSASIITQSGDKLFVSSTGPVAFTAPVMPRSTPISLRWTDITVDGNSIIDQVERSPDTLDRIEVPFHAVSDGVLRLEYGYDDHVRALDASHGMRVNESKDWIKGASPTVAVTGEKEWNTMQVRFAMLNSSERVISDPLGIQIEVSPPWYMLWKIDVRIATPLVFAIGLLLLVTQARAKRRQAIAVAQAAREREIIEAEMRGRLSEKEILLREIHHRVGNILSNFAANVRTMQRSTDSEEAKSMLEHLNARIKVQSAVHNLLQRSDRTDINVANMLRQVAAGARDFMGDGDSRAIQCHFDNVYMTYSKAQYLGLIVNELLTNSYKHSDCERSKPLAEIRLAMLEDGRAEFYYQDFGTGPSDTEINEALEKKRYGETGGLGQVIAMARELKGDPVVGNQSGMHLHFFVPANLIHRDVSGVVAEGELL